MMAGRRLARIAVVGLATLTMTACAPTGMPSTTPAHLELTPHPVGTAATEVPAAELELPPMFTGVRVLDPGWDVLPKAESDIYLGLEAERDRVVFSAVSENGTVLWTAERPVLCSAFVTSQSEERPLAILMNVTAGEAALSDTSISAYDLRTGDPVWGPVAVPGPHVGPGLVFAAPAEAAIGESGPRTAIDPGTGQTIADESDGSGLTILGERNGIVLLADDAQLFARTAGGRQLWTAPRGRLGLPTEVPRPAAEPSIDDVTVLIGDRDVGAVLLDLTSGEVISRAVRASQYDRSTGIRVILNDSLRAIDASGRPAWSREVQTGVTLISAGRGVAYLRGDDGISVVDTTSGKTLSSLPGSTVIPQQITTNGTGITGSYNQPLLLTDRRSHEEQEEQ